MSYYAQNYAAVINNISLLPNISLFLILNFSSLPSILFLFPLFVLSSFLSSQLQPQAPIPSAGGDADFFSLHYFSLHLSEQDVSGDVANAKH